MHGIAAVCVTKLLLMLTMLTSGCCGLRFGIVAIVGVEFDALRNVEFGVTDHVTLTSGCCGLGFEVAVEVGFEFATLAAAAPEAVEFGVVALAADAPGTVEFEAVVFEAVGFETEEFEAVKVETVELCSAVNRSATLMAF